MGYPNRLARSTSPPQTETPGTIKPVKSELYRKIWTRFTQAPKPAATILQEVISTCQKFGTDYIDVMTTAIAAQNEDAANDATSGGQ